MLIPARSCVRSGTRRVAVRCLHFGQLVTDPDGTLGLHSSPVRITDIQPTLDPGTLLIEYDVPGSSAFGCFTALRHAKVWVQTGGSR